MQHVTLAEANIDWHSDEQYNLETEDIQNLANKQEQLYLKAGQALDYTVEDGYFNEDCVTVYVLKNEEKQELPIVGIQSFKLPDEIGEYVIVFNLKTDQGDDAQYVGKIIIQ
ncbi:hypothetical protein AAGS61_10640 [Lysinibacillus sp. KU-BSD001]|uniref:hypothetical protein n=1 Tax=Lysinibacillus sp. KU-BSD001 TaxID=3141328 RepID=UPI0036E98CF1